MKEGEPGKDFDYELELTELRENILVMREDIERITGEWKEKAGELVQIAGVMKKISRRRGSLSDSDREDLARLDKEEIDLMVNMAELNKVKATFVRVLKEFEILIEHYAKEATETGVKLRN